MACNNESVSIPTLSFQRSPNITATRSKVWILPSLLKAKSRQVRIPSESCAFFPSRAVYFRIILSHGGSIKILGKNTTIVTTPPRIVSRHFKSNLLFSVANLRVIYPTWWKVRG